MAATVGRPCQGDWRPSGLTPAEASGEVLDVSDFSFFFCSFFYPFCLASFCLRASYCMQELRRSQ